jgi:putative transposase
MSHDRRTNIVRLLCDTHLKLTLMLIGNRVSALWNSADYLCRQVYFKGEKIPSYSRLCNILQGHKDYNALPTHIGQEVIKKLSKAWVSYLRLMRLYREGKLEEKPGLPRYRKDRMKGRRPCGWIPIKSKKAYSIKGDCFKMALPSDIRDGRLSIPYRGIIRYTGEYKTCDLKYDNATANWYAYVVVEAPEPERKERPDKYAASDLGARRPLALAIQGSSAHHIFSARELWKDFKYWTGKIALEQSRLSTQGLKTSRRLRQLYRMRRLRLRHSLEGIASKVTGLLKRHGVTQFKVGYPKIFAFGNACCCHARSNTI